MDDVSPWVRRFVPLLRSGVVLDLACGSGRHSRFLQQSGRDVLALDRNADELLALQADGVETICHDLEAGESGCDWPFQEQQFAGIIVTNYLHRALFPHILSSLKNDGLLIYETFCVGNEYFGRPSNPVFLLHPDELIMQLQSNQLVSMRLIAFEQGATQIPKNVVVQRICARKLSNQTESIEPFFCI